jgi:hypothetical protein
MVIGSVAMRTLARAHAVASFVFDVEGEGVGYTKLFATDGFSPLSDICDDVVVSGGEYCWRVCSSYWICLVLRIFTQ